jgi:hypothetical protein
LQNIVKHYIYEADGYKDIVDALSAMTGIAHHINNMKRRHEHAVRVQEIQSLLYGWEGEDLTTFGELCAEGAFRMYGAKALRHAFLFDRMLLITKKKEEGILGYKTHIMVSQVSYSQVLVGCRVHFASAVTQTGSSQTWKSYYWCYSLESTSVKTGLLPVKLVPFKVCADDRCA